MAVRNNQGGAPLGRPGLQHDFTHAVQVVHIRQAENIPAVGEETSADILVEGQVGAALDGDAVAVVDPDQVVELEVSCKACRLAGNAFHHAPVTHDGPDTEVE